jgi:hypothetical protein
MSTQARRWGKAGVRLTDQEIRGRDRTAAQRRAEAEVRAKRDEAEAYEAWTQGQIVPYRITQALDIRKLYGPKVDEDCGVREPVVDLWEAGEYYLTWDQLKALARLTGFPVLFFVTPQDGKIFTLEPSEVFICPPPKVKLEDKAIVLAFTREAIEATLAGICVLCRTYLPCKKHTYQAIPNHEQTEIAIPLERSPEPMTTSTSMVEENGKIGRENINAYLAARRAQLGHTPGKPDLIATAHIGPKEWAHLHDTDIEAALAAGDDASGKLAVVLDAFELLNARITRDLNFDAGEAAAPEDERWATTLDSLVQFASELAEKTFTALGY